MGVALRGAIDSDRTSAHLAFLVKGGWVEGATEGKGVEFYTTAPDGLQGNCRKDRSSGGSRLSTRSYLSQVTPQLSASGLRRRRHP